MTGAPSRAYVRDVRTYAGAQSLLAFARLYMPDRFTLPWNRMHREVADDLTSLGKETIRLAVGAPDGYGKTSLLALALPLWAISYSRIDRILLGSDRRGSAGELLQALLNEARKNQLLRRDFPSIARLAKHAESQRHASFSPRSLSVPNVIRIRTFGPNTATSELSLDGSPTELVILDDPDYDSIDYQGHSVYTRADQFQRFFNLLSSPRYRKVSRVVCGSLNTPRGVIDQMTSYYAKNPDSNRFYKAVEEYPRSFERWFEWAEIRKECPSRAQAWLSEHRDELLDGASVLWPEHETFEELMEQRVEYGWDWFDEIKQGLPPGGCLREGFNGRQFERLEGPPQMRCQVIDDFGFRRGRPAFIPTVSGEVFLQMLPLLEEPGTPPPNATSRAYVPNTF